MKINKIMSFFILVLFILAIGCSNSRPNKDGVVVLVFIDSLKNNSETFRTLKELTDADVGIKVNYIDIVIEPVLSSDYKVKCIPTFIILTNGVEVVRAYNADAACMFAVSEAMRIMNRDNTY